MCDCDRDDAEESGRWLAEHPGYAKAYMKGRIAGLAGESSDKNPYRSFWHRIWWGNGHSSGRSLLIAGKLFELGNRPLGSNAISIRWDAFKGTRRTASRVDRGSLQFGKVPAVH